MTIRRLPDAERRAMIRTVSLTADGVRYGTTPSQIQVVAIASTCPAVFSDVSRSSRVKSTGTKCSVRATGSSAPVRWRLSACELGWSTSKTSTARVPPSARRARQDRHRGSPVATSVAHGPHHRSPACAAPSLRRYREAARSRRAAGTRWWLVGGCSLGGSAFVVGQHRRGGRVVEPSLGDATMGHRSALAHEHRRAAGVSSIHARSRSGSQPQGRSRPQCHTLLR